MAQGHADEAARLAARLRTEGEGPGSLDTRRRALREIGRAITLDADHPAATRTMIELFTRPPTELPDEVEQALTGRAQEMRRAAARLGVPAYLSLLLYLPLFFWAGVEDPRPVLVYAVAAVASAIVSFLTARMPRPSARPTLLAAILSTIAMASTGTIFGPLVLTPGIVAVNVSAFAMTEARAERWVVVLIGLAAVAVPLGLELTGTMAPTYSFEGGRMLIDAWAVRLEGAPALTLLAVGALANIVTAVAVLGLMRSALTRAEERIELYSWQIRQLLP
jgi:serine/threonine-protein kinase